MEINLVETKFIPTFSMYKVVKIIYDVIRIPKWVCIDRPRSVIQTIGDSLVCIYFKRSVKLVFC